MPLNNLLRSLTETYPEITFQKDSLFKWAPRAKTVHYNPADPSAAALLLHELAHGILGHTDYARDIELLAMESDAWAKAKEIAPKLHVVIPEDVAEGHLDTYRDWLHARSACPECTATGFQTGHAAYACPACTHEWRVNEARICGLRRYSLKSA